MIVSFDPAKREGNLAKHGLDLADAARVFEGVCVELYDDRYDYGEDRWITYGLLHGEVVVCVLAEWRDETRIISLRKATRDEQERYVREIGG